MSSKTRKLLTVFEIFGYRKSALIGYKYSQAHTSAEIRDFQLKKHPIPAERCALAEASRREGVSLRQVALRLR
ncbi:hypothetical protein [Nostoc sp. FACHB-888]|uniref:hypothetical protein n=1 Tax=Nostoc sp. FACHB-888 TaxID=2692842 RepID=UPI0019A7AAA8|nr:hypothetical protein [Nostoc sp. FACHB-888]MBD2245610.1 hypothetical protein [Nostoc sp. FACHB-888]